MEIKFTKLSDGTAEEYRFLEELDSESNTQHVDNIIALFKTTDHETGYPLSPMAHGLQTATRALRDGADDEIVVAALLHDIADRIAPLNHAEVGAQILRPYISERTYWIMAHHAIFQGYYFWHHIGKNKDAREKYRGHQYFQDCAEFCEKWDQISFDPSYDTVPLEAFMPNVQRIIGRVPFSAWPR
jgi:predicted HD phosphohydrolase